VFPTAYELRGVDLPVKKVYLDGSNHGVTWFLDGQTVRSPGSWMGQSVQSPGSWMGQLCSHLLLGRVKSWSALDRWDKSPGWFIDGTNCVVTPLVGS
jgi:hypothetical protein